MLTHHRKNVACVPCGKLQKSQARMKYQHGYGIVDTVKAGLSKLFKRLGKKAISKGKDVAIKAGKKALEEGKKVAVEKATEASKKLGKKGAESLINRVLPKSVVDEAPVAVQPVLQQVKSSVDKRQQQSIRKIQDEIDAKIKRLSGRGHASKKKNSIMNYI